MQYFDKIWQKQKRKHANTKPSKESPKLTERHQFTLWVTKRCADWNGLKIERTKEAVYVICCLNRSFFLEIAKYLPNDDGVFVVCTDRQQKNALLESDHNTWTERTSMKGKLGHVWGEGTMGSKRESK